MEKTRTSKVVSILKNTLATSITYPQYRELVANHTLHKTSTGPTQTEALAQYTLLNNSRMSRHDKKMKVPEAIATLFKNFEQKQTWLVLTESWCGDAAQTIPMLYKLSQLAPNVSFKVALRDENETLMSHFLTNGGMAIPKLIFFDENTQTIKGDWGPRPSKATAMVKAFKKEHLTLTPAFKQDLQLWYNKDKGVSVAEDLAKIIKSF